jgi:hypothetical protein
MSEIRYYNTLKFKTKINYGSPEEEDAYFEKLHQINPQLAIEKTNEIYDELLHVNWSYKFLFGVLAIILAIISAFFIKTDSNITLLIFGISLILFIISRFFNYKLQLIYRSFIIGKELYKNSLNGEGE